MTARQGSFLRGMPSGCTSKSNNDIPAFTACQATVLGHGGSESSVNICAKELAGALPQEENKWTRTAIVNEHRNVAWYALPFFSYDLLWSELGRKRELYTSASGLIGLIPDSIVLRYVLAPLNSINFCNLGFKMMQPVDSFPIHVPFRLFYFLIKGEDRRPLELKVTKVPVE